MTRPVAPQPKDVQIDDRRLEDPYSGWRLALLLAGIAMVAFNLRPALASIGPLSLDIQRDTGLTSSQLGLLTTLPLVAFGLMSPVAPRLGRGLGMERAIGAGLVLIALGTALRAADSTVLLFVGTGVLGVGIAVGNVLLPALSKAAFPLNPGPITGLYSGMMGVGAALAAGISVPVASRLGWRGSLGVWAVAALVGLAIWLPRMRFRPRGRGTRAEGRAGSLTRSPTAWRVALYMGFQSLSFYVFLAWIPALLQAQGVSDTAAGGLLAFSQVTGIAASIVVPVWAGQVQDQRRIIWVLGVLEAVSLVGLMLPGGRWAALWVGLLGFVLGGTFSLALMLLVLRTRDGAGAARLSGMAQTVAYLLSALGPPIFGGMQDLTGSWQTLPLGLMLVLAVKVGAGLPAGRPGTVEDTA